MTLPHNLHFARNLSDEFSGRPEALALIRETAKDRTADLLYARQMMVNEGQEDIKFNQGDLVIIHLTPEEVQKIYRDEVRKLTLCGPCHTRWRK